MTRKEHRGDEHIIRLSADEGLEIFHPEMCTQEHVVGEELHSQYNCDIAHHVHEWGTDLHLKDVPDGIYLAQYWFMPGGWSGSYIADNDDGIDLTRLEVGPWPDGS